MAKLKILILLTLLACGFTAGAQELSCSFIQKKTLKATKKVIPGEGSITFEAPDHLVMTYTVPEGEYLIIDGNQLSSCSNGRVVKVDTEKNTRMRNMRNTLLNCITGAYEKAAEENDATLLINDQGNIKTVSMLAKKAQTSGYSKIVIDYNRKGLPVRMVLDEFSGIETEYTFSY
jgi:outer membrane lipoprotein-sorting protein